MSIFKSPDMSEVNTILRDLEETERKAIFWRRVGNTAKVVAVAGFVLSVALNR